jgi:hypothetical protein
MPSLRQRFTPPSLFSPARLLVCITICGVAHTSMASIGSAGGSLLTILVYCTLEAGDRLSRRWNSSKTWQNITAILPSHSILRQEKVRVLLSHVHQYPRWTVGESVSVKFTFTECMTVFLTSTASSSSAVGSMRTMGRTIALFRFIDIIYLQTFKI